MASTRPLTRSRCLWMNTAHAARARAMWSTGSVGPAVHPPQQAERSPAMKRAIAVLPVLVLFLLGTASPARADRPTREPATDFNFQFAAGDACPFAIEGTTTENNEYVTTYYDHDGNVTKQISSGLFVEQITNLDTGEANIRNISGPGVYTFAEDGTVTLDASGTWLFVTVPGGPSPVYINSGREV